MIIDARVLARYGLSVLSISVYQNKLSPFRTIYIIVYVFFIGSRRRRVRPAESS